MIQSAYIHIPFCKQICAYCDFFRCGYNALLAQKWLAVMSEEIKALKLEKLKTLYIGGGTPSALSTHQLECLLKLLQPSIDTECEYTMEANISHLNDELLKLITSYGINRLSLGVQSFQNHLLERVGRTHRKEDVLPILERIHQHGIDNISIDLIYGLPNQTLEMWQEDLAYAITLPITHISLYALTIEPNSRFAKEGVEAADENLDADMYEYACTFLKANGFEQYEISSFAKNQCYSKHNLCYWNYDDFYGIGCGASGKINDVRYDNTKNFIEYLAHGASPTLIELTTDEIKFEMIMMSLRKKEGLNLALYQKRFNADVYQDFKDAIDQNIAKQNLMMNEKYLYASEKGFEILNDILIDFL